MIKSIVGSGQYVQVTGGTPPSTYFNSGTPGSGMVRYNSNTNQLEVNDGNSWRQLDMGYVSVGLSSVAESALNWALQKMGEEEEFKRLSESHPAVKLAWENLNKAKDQLKATVILSKEYDKTTS
jgi:hypothetical protein